MAIQELVRMLSALPAATLYEAMGKVGGVHHHIRPMLPRSRLAGVAYTVRILPGETLAVLRAIEEAPVGSVLVIDTSGEGESVVWGGTSSLAAKVRGLAGCVTNGLVRDLDDLIEIGVPIYATGVTVTGTLKGHSGWVGLPVSVGGQVVRPGDVLVGDADGVVVIAQELAQDALTAALKQRAKEQARDARIKAGEPLTYVLGLR
ncbi:MAG: RraA family protein [Orrella sp.]|jgi:4-hydroxy-4-methyl-2-oxoglutarate aldolase|uniref:RraA family protein n=1 Tax=Orrella sp. TaxID=1921583 RepID=UPI003BE843F0